MLLPIIQKCYYNEHLLATDYDKILQKHQTKSFVKGSYLLQHSENLTSYYILLQGTIHGFVNNANGNQITINLYTTKDLVIDVNALFQNKQTVKIGSV